MYARNPRAKLSQHLAWWISTCLAFVRLPTRSGSWAQVDGQVKAKSIIDWRRWWWYVVKMCFTVGWAGRDEGVFSPPRFYPRTTLNPDSGAKTPTTTNSAMRPTYCWSHPTRLNGNSEWLISCVVILRFLKRENELCSPWTYTLKQYQWPYMHMKKKGFGLALHELRVWIHAHLALSLRVDFSTTFFFRSLSFPLARVQQNFTKS